MISGKINNIFLKEKLDLYVSEVSQKPSFKRQNAEYGVPRYKLLFH